MKETISKDTQATANYNMTKSLIIAGIGCAVAGFMYTLDLSDWITYILADFISGLTIAYALGQVIPSIRYKGFQVAFGFSVGSILYLTIGSGIYKSLPKDTNDFISNLVFNLFWITIIPTVMKFFIGTDKETSRKVFWHWLLATMLAVIYWSLQQIDITLSNMIGMAIFGISGCYLTLREVKSKTYYAVQPEKNSRVTENAIQPDPIKTEINRDAPTDRGLVINEDNNQSISVDDLKNNPQIKKPAPWKALAFGLLILIGIFWLLSSYNTDDNKLVGRHPEEWMPRYSAFSTINTYVPFNAKFAYLYEHEGITSYGYNWNEPTCPGAISSYISNGEVYVVLYKNISDAQAKLPNVIQFFKDYQGYQNTKSVQLSTNNSAEILSFKNTSCETKAHWSVILFTRNNVIGFVKAETFDENSDDILNGILLALGAQLDTIIQDELNNHPGNESDLERVIASARQIALPSDEAQSSGQSSNDLGGSNSSDTSQCYMDSYGNCHSADQCARIVNGTCILLAELMEQIEKDSSP